MTQLNVNDWPLVNIFNGTAGSTLTVEFGRPMYVRVK